MAARYSPMAREKLPQRRHGVTMPVILERPGGNPTKFDVTFNFGEDGRVKEAFMRSTKEGNDFSSLMIDACVALSMLLQHGETMASLLKSFAQYTVVENGVDVPLPTSALGAIARAGADLDDLAQLEMEPSQ